MVDETHGKREQQPLIDTYQQWVEAQNLPVIKGYSVPDLMAVSLKPWERKGGLGAFIQLIGAEDTNDAYLCEIPPGVKLKAQKHLFDELIYILSGRGATTIWNEGLPKQTIEWQKGSLFSPPLNAWHQHSNVQKDKPVRYIGVTLAPVFLNLFNDQDFIFHNSYVFTNRYRGEEDYFSAKAKLIGKRTLETNFVPDVITLDLNDNIGRGAGGKTSGFEMSGSLLAPHVSEFPVGTYKKAHRHSSGAHVIILSGTGYSLMWKGDEPRVRVDWKAGSLLVPPDLWFHQHFNTGPEPARYLALKASESKKFQGIRRHAQLSTSIKTGGDQIEYEDEDPVIRRTYKEELAKSGVKWQMSQFLQGD